VLLLGEDVVDHAAEERDVAARADRHVLVGQRAGSGEVRVDVDHPRATVLGLDDPLEAHRVGLGHVGAHDHDVVGVHEPVRAVGGAAAPQGGSQTGNGGGVSNTGLVLDLYRAQRGEQLLDQVVLFVVQGGPAEGGEPGGAAQDPALGIGVLPALVAGGQYPIGHHLHRRVQVQV